MSNFNEIESGDIIITSDTGNRTVISREYQRYIWEKIEIENIKNTLLGNEVIRSFGDTLQDDFMKLVNLFYNERKALLEANRDLLCRWAITDYGLCASDGTLEDIPETILEESTSMDEF